MRDEREQLEDSEHRVENQLLQIPYNRPGKKQQKPKLNQLQRNLHPEPGGPLIREQGLHRAHWKEPQSPPVVPFSLGFEGSPGGN